MDIPRGVPVSVVARTLVPDGAPNDLRVNGKKLLVDSQSNRGEFSLDHIYGPEHGPEHLFERTISPVIKALLEGVSVSVVFVGSSNSSKSEDARATLSHSVEDLVRNLDQKRQSVEKQRGRGKRLGKGYEFNMKLSAFELFDEGIKDLFDPRRRDLQVSDNSSNGQYVEGASVRGPLVTVDQIIDSIDETMENRTTVISEFGPASKYTSTVWVFDIFQQTPGSSDHHVSTLRSRFTVLELAGSEKLAEDMSSLRMREGPTMNKGLHTVKLVIDALANSPDPAGGVLAPYHESKLTQLLKETFGGNVIAICIASLVMGEAAATMETLKLARAMHSTATYPVVNDDRAQGLLRRYRQEIINLRFELEAGHGNKVEGGEEHDYLVRINELEGKAVRSGLEMMRVKEEKDQVYNKLVEFRKKYNELVEAKAAVQAALIRSEEEKLKISKALVDLQLENNQLVERSETEKYDLVSKLLNAENEVLQLEMKEENRDKTNSNLAEELANQRTKHKKLQEDFVALQMSFTKVESSYKDEIIKNEELGVELLNLVNHKNTLRGEIDTLRREHSRLQQESTQLRSRCKEMSHEQEELKSKIKVTEDERESMRNEKSRLEIAVKRSELEFESTRLDLNKMSHEAVQQKDAEILGLKRANEQLQQNVLGQKELLMTRVKGLEHCLEKVTRKCGEMESLVQERETLLQEAQVARNKLDSKLQSATETFREKIIQSLSGDTLTSHPETVEEEKGSENECTEIIDVKNNSNVVSVDELRKELVGSFENRENELLDTIKELNQKFEDMLRRNRVLFSKYQRIKDQLDDILPTLKAMENATGRKDQSDTSASSVHDLNELVTDSAVSKLSSTVTDGKCWWNSPEVVTEDTKLRNELHQLEEDQRQEISILKDKLSQVLTELNQSKERSYATAEQNQREIREWQQKYNDISSQLALVEKQKFNLQEENEALARRKASEKAGLDEVASNELRKLQEELLKKIDGLKDYQQSQLMPSESNDTLGPLSPSRRSLASTSDLSATELASENAKLKKELTAMRAERRKSRRQTLMSKAGSGNDDGAQGRVPELLTKLTVAEEELESYKRIMKQSMSKNKKALAKVKAEAAFWKEKAIAAGVSASLKP